MFYVIASRFMCEAISEYEIAASLSNISTLLAMTNTLNYIHLRYSDTKPVTPEV